MKHIPISMAREAGRIAGARRVAIIAVDDDGMFTITTWGRSKAECRGAARWCDSDDAALAARDLADA